MTTKMIPSEFILKDLFNLLHRDNYGILQFVPSGPHSDIYKENELPRLIESESRLMGWAHRREPIIYEYSFAPGYYYNNLRINPKQRLLGRLFLLNNILSIKEMRNELPEYLDLVDNFLEKTNDGEVSLPFRIVPLFSFMILADTLACDFSDKVFLYRDSCLLSAYLKRKTTIAETIVDIGTGSGCLAIVASSIGAKKICAVDINERALEFAKLNIRLNGCDDIVTLQNTRIDDIINEKKVDCIISNPPYMYSENSNLPTCVNGGASIGMEIPLRFVKLATRNKLKIIMILAVPLINDKNLFEALLPKEANIIKKEVIEINRLYDAIESHRVLIKEGVTHKEVAIYELVAR